MIKKSVSLFYCLILLVFHTGVKAQCSFTNPLKMAESADPFVTFIDGYYYYLYTTGGDVTIRKSFYLNEIGKAEGVKVWDYATANSVVKGHVWAPELHRINGKWYVYTCGSLTADQRSENMRMIVLQAFSDDPQSDYAFKAVIADVPAIDESIWLDDVTGKYYISWSQFDPEGQCIYIAPLENPTKVGFPRVKISSPQSQWEKNGWNVNEGPIFIKKNNKLHISFSASGCSTPDYCLGLLTCSDGDYLNAASWLKTGPVFKRSDSNGVYGPGHNCFVQSPDGSEIWNVYHAKSSSENTNADRSTRMQTISWDVNDHPVFGIPVKPGKFFECPSEDDVSVATVQNERPVLIVQNGQLTIRPNSGTAHLQIRLFNLNGTMLASKSILESEFSKQLQKGFYLVQIFNDRNLYNYKIIIH